MDIVYICRLCKRITPYYSSRVVKKLLLLINADKGSFMRDCVNAPQAAMFHLWGHAYDVKYNYPKP